MATNRINETLERNYMKLLKHDDSNTPKFEAKFANSGAVLVDKILLQNVQVLEESSKLYEAFVALKEESQVNIVKLDSILEQVGNLKGGVGGGVVVSGTPGAELGGDSLSITNSEFDKKLGELDFQIKKCDEKIEEEKKILELNSEKIKDTKEYLQKFILEKRLYLDKVEELPLREKSKYHKVE